MNTKSIFSVWAIVAIAAAVVVASAAAVSFNNAYADGFKNQGQCNKFVNKLLGSEGIHGPFVTENRKAICESNQ
ncbi:MAG: hypothetical protein ACTHJ7_00255 [Candidatus Nitrosocosmicus sp.]